jgi:hypothetical protein
MGEIAEMMLDGTLCEACGDFIGSDAGFPQYCSPSCAAGRGMAYAPPAQRSKPTPSARRHERHDRALRNAGKPKPFKCSKCTRRFRTEHGLAHHKSDKHVMPAVRP